MANAAVLGSTFCSIAFKFFSRNDSRPQDPLINWSVVAMLEPEAMLGSLLGSVLYNWMPQSASVLLLVSVLGGISTRMLSVGMHEWQKTANPYVELESVEISPAAGVAAYRSMTEFSDAVHVTRPVGVVIPWRIISILLMLFCGCTVINAVHLIVLRHDAGPALRGLFSPLLTFCSWACACA